MNLFSYNSFLLGTLVFVCIIVTNLIFFLLCKMNKIKVLEFSIFFAPWFSIVKKKIGSTVFSLGWIPLGSSVKPLGWTTDIEERRKIPEEEFPFVFFTRPKYLKVLFKLASPFTYLLILFVSLKLYSDDGKIMNGLEDIFNFINSSIKALFGSQNSKDELSILFKKIVSENNLVLFVFMIFLSVITLILPFTTIMNWYSNDEIKKSKIEKTIGFLGSLFYLYFFLWKLPNLFFNYFTWLEFMRYFISFLLGIFSVGVIAFYLLLSLIKIATKSS